MTALELLRRLRVEVLRDTGGDTGVPDAWLEDDSGCRWSNAALCRYLAEAEEEAARRAYLLLDSQTPEICRIHVLPGQADYPIHERVLKVDRVELASAVSTTYWRGRLTRVNRMMLDHGDICRTGQVHHYLLDMQGRTLTLVDTPTQEDELRLTVFRLPLRPFVTADPEDGSITEAEQQATPEILHRHHPDLIDYAAYLAFLSADPESEDAQRAATWMARFERKFGPRPTAEQERTYADLADTPAQTAVYW